MHILFAPTDAGVSLVGGRPGCAGGPAALRPDLPPRLLLDVPMQGTAEAYDADRGRLADAVAQTRGPVLVVGGDHGLSHSVVQGRRARGRAPAVVYVDPHWDLRPFTPRHTSGSSFRRIIDEGLVPGDQVWNLGHQTPEDPERAAVDAELTQAAQERGVNSIPMDILLKDPVAAAAAVRVPAGYHLSLDVDALDRSVAPGVSAPGDGRLSLDQYVALVRALPRPASADLMEYAPPLDIAGRTRAAALTLARVLLERLGG